MKGLFLWLTIIAVAASAPARQEPSRSILTKPAPRADQRIHYASDPNCFGDLWLPENRLAIPVVVVIHGGCWLAEYNLAYIGHLAHALTAEGVAAWSLEYRRVGDSGGGWPGTFEDIGKGIDHLRSIAATFHLDLARIVVVGHSAGGQLALWAAARPRLSKESPLYSPDPLPIRGVVSLAGIPDLRRQTAGCEDAAQKLLGGAAESLGSRYAQASPINLLPLGVKQWLIHGERDRMVPAELEKDYAEAARKSGDAVRLTILPTVGHFDLIDPDSPAWPIVRDAVLDLLKQ
jgi:acetyl esterase/lipase